MRILVHIIKHFGISEGVWKQQITQITVYGEHLAATKRRKATNCAKLKFMEKIIEMKVI